MMKRSSLLGITILSLASACNAATDVAHPTSTLLSSRPAAAESPVPFGQPSFPADTHCGTYDGGGCAPTEARVDIERPAFSNPTIIDNPLFPVGRLTSVVFLGEVDGVPFRSETTLLPTTGTVVVDGKPIDVLMSQYLAYLDGRITEVAVDRYAQADDGSVWYLGEDVYDFEAGQVAVTEGTWLAGRDGPPAMIMPGTPAVGQVFRAEDIPGIVWEEITVRQIDRTLDGPLGSIDGGLLAQELHLDGTTSEKVFAPGYGEFYTATGTHEVEALALAATVDATGLPEPAQLAQLVTASWGLLESVRLEEWEAVASTLDKMNDMWAAVSEEPVPVLVGEAMSEALAALDEAVGAQQVAATANAAVDVAQLAIDLELRYRSAAYVDLGRFFLHTQQLRIDAAAGDSAGVAAEVTTLEWIRDRITGTLDAREEQRIDDRLGNLRAVAASGDLASAATLAAELGNLARAFAT